MKLIFKLLMAAASMLVLFLIVGMFLPSQLIIEGSVKTKIASDKIYPIISDLKRRKQWAMMDLNIEPEFEGNPSGVGAIMHWKSDHALVRSGSMKIIEADKSKGVKIVMVMEGMGKAYSYINMSRQAGETVLSRKLEVHFGYNIPGRIRGLMYRDEMQQEFQQSLVRLLALVQ